MTGAAGADKAKGAAFRSLPWGLVRAVIYPLLQSYLYKPVDFSSDSVLLRPVTSMYYPQPATQPPKSFGFVGNVIARDNLLQPDTQAAVVTQRVEQSFTGTVGRLMDIDGSEGNLALAISSDMDVYPTKAIVECIQINFR